MRFLCLHGMGTNGQVWKVFAAEGSTLPSIKSLVDGSSGFVQLTYAKKRYADTIAFLKIFEMQTAAIRYGLGGQHTYEFLEGSIPAPMAPGIEPLVSPADEFFRYIDESSSASFFKALADLDTYIAEAGPFDAVMAFSEGAALAASLMIRKFQEDPRQQQLHPLFNCAIFFSGGVPGNRSSHAGKELRLMDPERDGELIRVPTAHIWGENDRLYPSFGPVLNGLCKREQRAVFVHKGGHEIPGPKSADEVAKVVDIINRTIERCITAQ